jgi:hypothetical protein
VGAGRVARFAVGVGAFAFVVAAFAVGVAAGAGRVWVFAVGTARRDERKAVGVVSAAGGGMATALGDGPTAGGDSQTALSVPRSTQILTRAARRANWAAPVIPSFWGALAYSVCNRAPGRPMFKVWHDGDRCGLRCRAA